MEGCVSTDPFIEICGVLHDVFGFSLLMPVLDGVSCFGEVGNEGGNIWIISSEYKGRG